MALVACYYTPVSAEVSSSWQTTEETLSREVLERSNVVSDFTALINEHFSSSAELPIENLSVTINDDQLPHIDVVDAKLILPYRYLTYAIKSHADLEETKEAALERAINTVEYTVYHLFGHYIAADNGADSDDIAEALSSWLMIKGFTNGGEQWFANAEAFGRASQLMDGPLQDYWHEHSLYKSRQEVMNCWILGSAPDRYRNLFRAVLDPQERTQRCIAEWNKLDSDMQNLLKDNIKPDSSLIAK